MKKYSYSPLVRSFLSANRVYTSIIFLFFFGFSAFHASAQDAYLQGLEFGKYIKPNTNYSISVKARNTVNSPTLTSFKIGWRWNNGQINYTPQITIGGAGIGQNNSATIPHPTPLNVPTQGTGTLKVWIVGQGDNNHSNDTVTLQLKVISNYAVKHVLMEVKTAIWCQYCPAANVVANTLNQDPKSIVVKLHDGDALSNTNTTAYLDQNMNVSYTPANMIDQGEYGTYAINSQHPSWQAAIDGRELGVSPADIQINPTYNTSNRQLTVEVISTILYPEAGEYRINAYILEDNVVGAQTNGGAGNNYIHNQVLREILGPVSGTTGVIPQNPVQGQAYTHTYTYTLPQAWNYANVRIVAYVTHIENGKKYTLNARQVNLHPAMGIYDNTTLDENQISIYPNPFTENFSVAFSNANPSPYTIELFSVDGTFIQSLNFTGGGTSLELTKLGNLAAGNYFLRIGTAGQYIVKKVIKQ